MNRNFTLDDAAGMRRIDARDIEERRDALESERDDLDSKVEEAQEALDDFDPEEGGGDEAELQQNLANAKRDRAAWDATDEGTEYAALVVIWKAIDDFDGRSATLIAESDFENYAREVAEDVADMKDSAWPMTHIDWAGAAKDLQTDFTSVEIGNRTFYFR